MAGEGALVVCDSLEVKESDHWRRGVHAARGAGAQTILVGVRNGLARFQVGLRVPVPDLVVRSGLQDRPLHAPGIRRR
jgi:hypothetical protein